MDYESFIQHIRGISSIFFARIEEDGVLLDASVGFLDLVSLDHRAFAASNVKRFFIQPDFEYFEHAEGEHYKGLFTVGSTSGKMHSLNGFVCRDGQQWIFIGACGFQENDQINIQLVNLNFELTESHRELVRGAAIRKRVELELAESEARFRIVIDHNLAIILQIDSENGRIIDANEAACRFYGWSKPELCAKNIADLTELDPKAVAEEYHAAAEEKRNYFVFPQRLANGDTRTVEVHSTPLDIKGKTIFVSIIHDITARIADEEALALQSSKLAAELILANIANKELTFQNGDKAKRAAELVIANIELAFQREEKAKRAAELVAAKVELAFQSEEKATRAAELVLAKIELAFQSIEKAKRADELVAAKGQIDFQDKRITSKASELLDSASDGIQILDETGRLMQCSRSFARMLGYTQEEILGRKIMDWDANLSISQISRMLKDLIGTSKIFETIHRRKDGTLIDVEINAKGILINGKKHVYASSRDITERKRLQEQIEQLAFYDPLTKLPNRRLLDDRLNQVVVENRRSRCHGAVLFIDLDNFKPLNDAWGHDAGDVLLVEVAQRLKSSVREVDTVARTGGDEFVVVISELEQDLAIARQRALEIAEKIRLTLDEPYVLEMQHNEEAALKVEHHCTASIGVVIFSGDAARKAELLKRADDAMYQAKEAGRNRIQFDDVVL